MIIGSREPRSVVDPHVPRISSRPATSRRALSTRKANSNNFTVATDKENLDPLPSARSKEKKDRPSSSREKKKRPKAKALDGVAPCVISEEAQAAAVAASPCNASNATVAAADEAAAARRAAQITVIDATAALALDTAAAEEEQRLLEQLHALRTQLAAAAHREQAHERAKALLEESRGKLNVASLPPHPFMLAVSGARQQQLRAPLIASSEAVVEALRAELKVAHGDNAALMDECARLRERVRELESFQATAEATVQASLSSQRSVQAVAPPPSTPALNVLRTPGAAEDAEDSGEVQPEESLAKEDWGAEAGGEEGADDEDDSDEDGDEPSEAVRLIFDTTRSPGAVEPSEAQRWEAAYKAQRNAAIGSPFGTAFGTPARHKQWQLTPRGGTHRLPFAPSLPAATESEQQLSPTAAGNAEAREGTGGKRSSSSSRRSTPKTAPKPRHRPAISAMAAEMVGLDLSAYDSPPRGSPHRAQVRAHAP
jgi:hypothetical protein